MKYCAIDSACFSGKSTTIKGLEGLGVAVLYEPQTQPNLPPAADLRIPVVDQLDGYRERIDGLIEAERMRTESMAKMSTSGLALLVADRSPLSTIVFEDMSIRYRHGNISDRQKAREYAIEQLDGAVRSGDIVMPNCLVVMDLADEAEFYRRVEERGPTTVAPLNEFEPSRFMNEQTLTYASMLLGSAAVARLTVTGEDSPDDVTKQVLKTISDLPQGHQPQQLARLWQ